MIKKTNVYWLVGLVVVLSLAVVSIYYYVNNFYDYELSRSPSDWADFATYISGTIGVLIVMSTLGVLVGTFKQQQELVNSQATLINAQFEALKQNEEYYQFERKKVEASRNVTSMMLFHHFATLEQLFKVIIHALESQHINDAQAKSLIYVSNKRPDVYSPLLMSEDANVMDLFSRLDVELLVNGIEAVVNAKEVFEYIEFIVNGNGAVQVSKIKIALTQDQDKNTYYLDRAQKGLKACCRSMELVKCVIKDVNSSL